MTTLSGLPSYDELPVRDGAPPHSSWGLWGERDFLGCLNLLTAERVRAAVREVRDGAVFSLNWDMELPDPTLFGRCSLRHEVVWIDDGLGHDDELYSWNTQASSQWDGFRHVRHPQHGFYSGIADEDHGVDHWARKGIVGRGVVCDVWRWRRQVGRPIDESTNDVITAEDVTSTLRHRARRSSRATSCCCTPDGWTGTAVSTWVPVATSGVPMAVTRRAWRRGPPPCACYGTSTLLR